MKTVTTARTPEEAHMMKHLLENEGITCIVCDEDSVSGSVFPNSSPMGGYRIQVGEAHWDEAQRILGEKRLVPDNLEERIDKRDAANAFRKIKVEYQDDARVFRALVIVELFIYCLFHIWPIVFKEQHPDHVMRYLESLSVSSSAWYFWGTLHWIFFFIGVGSSIGLYFFKEWAKYTYLLCWGYGLVGLVFSGAGITSHGMLAFLASISTLCAGAIIALFSYSPIMKYFNPVVNEPESVGD